MSKRNNDCSSCGEGLPKNDCSKSKRPCGHCCNHSWSHDKCCWCGREYVDEVAGLVVGLVAEHGVQ